MTTVVEPSTHTVASGMSPLFPNFYGVPFTVPAGTVGFAASSAGGDTFDVGVFTAASWATYSSGGAGALVYAQRARTSRADGAASLPAGNYVLGFYCRNLIERCSVLYAVSASY